MLQDSETLQADYEKLQKRNKERNLEIESYQWRSHVLEGQREGYQSEIKQNRLKLAQLESHIKELESRWQSVLNQSENITQLSEESTENHVDWKMNWLVSGRKSLPRRPNWSSAVESQKYQNSYAIIPYQGEHGTHRRRCT